MEHKKRGDEMSPRTGRPKVDKPKNVDIKVRFDEEGNELLIEYCERNNITRTEAIRQAVKKLLEEEKK